MAVRRVLCGVPVAGAVGLALIYRFIRSGERETVRTTADAIVVLGAQVHRDGRLSAALRGRVQRGVALYDTGHAPRLIMTGGVGEAGIAEAAVMQGIVCGLGVPKNAVVLEPTATSTAESARAIAAICARAGWRSVIVVSDPFHLARTALLFRAAGLVVQTAATDDWYFSARSRRYYRAREMAAVFVRILRGELPPRLWQSG